jgi:hypothetical protein
VTTSCSDGLVQRQAEMMAMTDTFWPLSLVFVAMVPIALLLKSTRRQVGPIHMERASPSDCGLFGDALDAAPRQKQD